jgi:hypothetical protein
VTDSSASSPLDEIRDLLEAARRAAESEGRALKNAMLPLERLREAYSRFTPEAQSIGGLILAEWLESEDENRRFDALVLIDEFRVAAAASVLQRLADKLRDSGAPGAPFEREKIGRILDRLGGLHGHESPTTPIPDLGQRMTIRTPADLGGVLSMIRAATSAGELTQAVGQEFAFLDVEVAGLPADGPWPDLIHAEFRDRAGRRYRLSAETYHGAGGDWAPLDDDA